jgi:hypothetical protein
MKEDSLPSTMVDFASLTGPVLMAIMLVFCGIPGSPEETASLQLEV